MIRPALLSRRRGPGGVLCFQGDSITYGFGLEPGEEWPAQCVPLLDGRFTWFNEAASGRKVEDMIANRSVFGGDPESPLNMDRRIAAEGRWGFASDVVNVLVVFGGTNDLNAGASAATTISRLSTYIADSFTAGWERVVLGSMLRRNGGPTVPADRVAVNEWQASQANGSTIFYADFADDPLLDNPSDLAGFYDGTHPTAAGAAVIASYFATAINQAVGL